MTVRKWSTLVAIKVGLVTKVIASSLYFCHDCLFAAMTVRKWSTLVAIKVGLVTKVIASSLYLLPRL